MKRFWVATFTLMGVALALSLSLHAKGATTRITISGPTLSAPINITNEAVVSKFQVWAGPGVMHGRGPVFQGGGTVTEETQGFIIDWSSGVVADHPNGLSHYEVAFYVGSADQPVYVVSYEPDSSSGQGYVYLPGNGDDLYPVNSRAMFHGHGFEGHWLRASSEWQDVAASLIARAGR